MTRGSNNTRIKLKNGDHLFRRSSDNHSIIYKKNHWWFCLGVIRQRILHSDLKVQDSFYLGTAFSRFTPELCTILMALNYTCNIQLEIFHFLICVDSKSVLYALQNWDCKVRKDIVYEVKYLIHYIMSRGIGIEFCWVPSYWGIYWNEIWGKLAEHGTVTLVSNWISTSCHPHRVTSGQTL